MWAHLFLFYFFRPWSSGIEALLGLPLLRKRATESLDQRENLIDWDEDGPRHGAAGFD